MSFTFRLWIVLERCSIVEDGVVMDELYIPGFKLHRQIELRIVGELVLQIERFDLLCG